MSDTPLMQFPHRFPLKVMGRAAADFSDQVLAIVGRHVPEEDLATAEVSQRPSRDGNFLAVTVIFEARSQAQLDALYRELTAADEILMAL